MNKKILAAAIAALVATPSAIAAQDTSGMQYTSAAEGFYASIRARYNSGSTDDAGQAIENQSSRFGVRGTNDLGGGLEGFYQYEAGVDISNGGSLRTRLGHVGLRGTFGQMQVGSFWTQGYNWVYGSTDVANTHSGNLVYSKLFPARISKAVEYTSPDLNGFQVAGVVMMDKDQDGEGAINRTGPETITYRFITILPTTGANAGIPTLGIELPAPTAGVLLTRPILTTPQGVEFLDVVAGSQGQLDRNDRVVVRTPTVINPKDDNDLDYYMLAAKYAIQGFDVAASYSVIPDGQADGNGREDLSAYAVRLGYTQDNWYVGGWYSEDNAADGNASDDVQTFSVAGGVAVDKVNFYGVYENQDSGKNDDTHGTVGVQYNFGARSRVWIEYAAQDLDSNDVAADYVNIGLRHDF